MPFCTNCGKEVAESTNFCSSCGYNLKQAPTLQPSPPLRIQSQPSRAVLKKSHRLRNIGVSILVVVVLLFVIGATVGPFAKPISSPQTSTQDTYNLQAVSIMSSAVQKTPTEYRVQSTTQLNATAAGFLSGTKALLVRPETIGSTSANLTVIVFDSTSSAQSYFQTVMSKIQNARGYTDVTASLNSYTQYGKCFGYSVETSLLSSAVTAMCTKKNVFFSVRVSSVEAASLILSLEMPNVLDAVYGAIS